MNSLEKKMSMSGIEARFLGHPVRTLILIQTEISQVLGVLYALLQCAYTAAYSASLNWGKQGLRFK